jgi:hypothetical protein
MEFVNLFLLSVCGDKSVAMYPVIVAACSSSLDIDVICCSWPCVDFSICKMGAVWQYSFARRKTECCIVHDLFFLICDNFVMSC